MKTSLKETVLTVLVFAFSALGAGLALPGQQTVAQEGEQPAAEQQQTEATTSDESYRYVTQPGDSYSLMARKAIQTYGIENKVDLSLAQIMMAETNLTNEAGEPYLAIGQEVAIAETAVAAWVERAGAISAEAEAAWQYYVQFAEFNTNNVGETSS